MREKVEISEKWMDMARKLEYQMNRLYQVLVQVNTNLVELAKELRANTAKKK